MADSTKRSNFMSRSMNPWVLHLQKLGLELKCPLCLDLLKRPFLLPCDHVFCNSCLPETTPFASDCPVCKAQYFRRDLKSLPLIENMVAIYRSLDATICANMFQSSCSDSEKILGQCPISATGECNDKLCKDPFKAGQEDKVTREANAKEYQMIGGVAKHNVGSTPLSLEIRSNQADLVSAGSPPSFADVKSIDNDSSDQADSLINYQATRLIKRYPDDITGQVSHDGSASETEAGNSRETKRHKKLDYGPSSSLCTNKTSTISSQPENLVPCSLSEHNLVLANVDEQPPVSLESSSGAKTICGFCQSSKISKDSGPMLHYYNGKLLKGDETSLSDALHVHRACIEWAPQVYFVDDETVKNLKAELARGLKLKCTRCGLKGAALGCYQKSCRRSYHVTCAKEIAGCRWDYDNFLLLCPSHSSVRFPDEKRSKSKKRHFEHQDPTQIALQQPNFWGESSSEAKEWVLCGSALSSDEKRLLVEFGTMIGVPVTKFWKPNVTHVIAATDANGACTRTLKVLMAILNGRWVLTIDWVKACMKSMHPVNEEPYEVNLDNHGCHDGPKTGRLSVLNNEPKLFSRMSFYFSGDFVSGYKADLQNLVVSAGGNILESKENLANQSQDYESSSRILIVYNLDPPQGCKLGEEVTILWQRLNEAEDLACKIGSQVIGHTWLLESIASYKLQPFLSLSSIQDDDKLLV